MPESLPEIPCDQPDPAQPEEDLFHISVGVILAGDVYKRQVHLPSYVPQGFEVQEVKSSPRSILIDYRDGEKVLYISQRYMEIDGNASIQIDTEDAKTEYLDANENRALYVEKEGWRKIYIFENDCFTKIRSNGLSKRKLLKVAKSPVSYTHLHDAKR